jgi:Alpha amylase, catalytic domain
MGAMMQTFYWNCPGIEGKDFHWWEYITSKLAILNTLGFTALWLPPACKGGGGKTMGYDPYDYYDMGDIDQKYMYLSRTSQSEGHQVTLTRARKTHIIRLNPSPQVRIKRRLCAFKCRDSISQHGVKNESGI